MEPADDVPSGFRSLRDYRRAITNGSAPRVWATMKVREDRPEPRPSTPFQMAPWKGRRARRGKHA